MKPLRFIHESVWSVIHAMRLPDTLEMFDKVLVIENEYAKARQKNRTHED